MMYIFLLLATLYFLPLILISAASSIWLLLFRESRLPLSELADFRACPFRRELQYDMGAMNKFAFDSFSDYGKTHLISFAASSPKMFVDIGSGDGRTTIQYLRRIFGDKKILLTDAIPNVESWRELAANENNVDFCKHSKVISDVSDLTESKDGTVALSLLNSLHHLSNSDFRKFLIDARERRAWIFIMDAKRLNWLHPLLIPFFYWFFYVALSWSGSGHKFHSSNYFWRAFAAVAEAWIMSFDQAVGSARRFSLDTILRNASKLDFVSSVDQDWLMNYILLIPGTCDVLNGQCFTIDN